MINNNNIKNSPCTQVNSNTKDNNPNNDDITSSISFYVLSNILFNSKENISNDISDLSMLYNTIAPSACPSEVSDDDDEWSVESLCKKKNVRFAEEIVSDVRTRPRTPQDLVGTLFYNAEEISQFREQYYAYLDEQEEEQENESFVMPGSRKFVSKVCALHDGQVHMYHEDNADTLNFDHPSFWNGSLTWWY